MSGRWLPDINVLLAIGDASSQAHPLALKWFETRAKRDGWATCPLTENGFIRILMLAAYPGGRRTQAQAFSQMEVLRTMNGHAFLPDDISITDYSRFDLEKPLGTKQLTDAYLLALAVKHRAKLVTFDRRIDASFVRGGESALEILPTE